MTGSSENTNVLRRTNLSASTNDGGALRFVDLTSAVFDTDTDWRNVFLDASVTLPDPRPAGLGDLCQLQWAGPTPLSDEMYFAHWRGWVEAQPNYDDFLFGWTSFAPEEWHDIPPIAPPENCVWHTGPLPDSGD